MSTEPTFNTDWMNAPSATRDVSKMSVDELLAWYRQEQNEMIKVELLSVIPLVNMRDCFAGMRDQHERTRKI